MPGGKLVGNMWRQASPHDVVDPQFELVIEAQRSRLLRMKNGPFSGQKPNRPERAAVGRRVRIGQRLEQHLNRNHDAVAARVDGIGRLIRVVSKIHYELAVGNRNLNAEHPIIVLRFLYLECPFGQIRERFPRDLLAVFHEIFHGALENFDPVFFGDRRKSALPDPNGRDSGPYIAFQRIRHPRIHLHDFEHGADRIAGVHDLYGREPQSFLENLRGFAGERSRGHPSDIRIVRDIRGPRYDAPFGEHRHCDHDVVQVRHAAAIRIVGGEHVARQNVAGFVEFRYEHFDGFVENPDECRNAGSGRRQFALRIHHAGAHVQDFVDYRAHRRLFHRGEHFVGGRLERVLDYFKRELIIGRTGHFRSPVDRPRCGYFRIRRFRPHFRDGPRPSSRRPR